MSDQGMYGLGGGGVWLEEQRPVRGGVSGEGAGVWSGGGCLVRRGRGVEANTHPLRLLLPRSVRTLLERILVAEISFASFPDTFCVRSLYYYQPTDNVDNCKDWCATRADCGGFIINSGICGFVGNGCKKRDMSPFLGTTTFLKEVN